MQQVKGVVARSRGAPVEIVTINVPDPGTGEAVVKVQACGKVACATARATCATSPGGRHRCRCHHRGSAATALLVHQRRVFRWVGRSRIVRVARTRYRSRTELVAHTKSRRDRSRKRTKDFNSSLTIAVPRERMTAPAESESPAARALDRRRSSISRAVTHARTRS
jgi:hypothetical protein